LFSEIKNQNGCADIRLRKDASLRWDDGVVGARWSATGARFSGNNRA
jgi:hypothetical protein